MRVGKRCRLFLFLVFLSCISWLYLKKDLKKLGKVLFLNLYQNFTHWILNMSEIFNNLNPWIKAQCGSYICCLSWYEQHFSAAWKFCSIQPPNMWYQIVAGIILKKHTWFLEQTVANIVYWYCSHCSDVIMRAMACQITSLTIIYLTVYSGADQKKTLKLRVTGLCAGNSPVTGEFPAQMANNADNVSIWWCHHDQHLTANIAKTGSTSIRHRSYKASDRCIVDVDPGVFTIWASSISKVHVSPLERLTAPNHYLKQCWLIIKSFCGIHLKCHKKCSWNP